MGEKKNADRSLATALTSCVTLGKLFNLARSQLSQSEANKATF